MPEKKPPDVTDVKYDDFDNQINPLQQATASCSGAIVTSLFVTPLDVVKIRLQAQEKTQSGKCFLYYNGLMDHLCTHSKCHAQPVRFNGTIDAFIKIGKTEGVTALWSGLSPTLVLAIPATIVYFVIYEQLRMTLKNVYNNKMNLVGQNRVQPFWIPIISGATARVFSVSVVSPLELIRTKMQSEKMSYLEVHRALKALIKVEGIKGLWRGIFPTLYRDVPFSAIYWLHYETIKARYCQPNSLPTFWLCFSAGAIAGSVAAAATTPFDVIKTHQQIEFGENGLYGKSSVKRRSTATILKEIYNGQGVRGLFTGTVPRLIRVAPACAIMISSFEYAKVLLRKDYDRKKEPFSERNDCFHNLLACVPV